MPGLTCAWILAPSRWRPSFTNLTVKVIICHKMILIKDVVLFRAPSGPWGEACQRHVHGQERAAGRLPSRDGAARRLPDPQRLQLQVSTSSQIVFNFHTNIFSFLTNIFRRPNDVVPIIVGCALAGMVVMVLVAYMVGRSRSRARGYQSV